MKLMKNIEWLDGGGGCGSICAWNHVRNRYTVEKSVNQCLSSITTPLLSSTEYGSGEHVTVAERRIDGVHSLSQTHIVGRLPQIGRSPYVAFRLWHMHIYKTIENWLKKN